MKAIIFAAGLGTRLKDITNEKPKALVEVNGVSLLEIAIRKLKYFGFKDIIINVHHFSEQIKTFVKNLRYDDLRITVSDESFKLLGTGGGIKKASGFFSGEEAFLAYNVDVITDLDPGELYRKHITSGALATLAVRKRDTSRYLLVDDQNILCGWCNVKTGERIISREKPEELTSVAFSGIHIISTQLPGLITEDGYCNIIDVYLRLASDHDILTVEHDSGFWFDVGTPEQVKEVSIFLEKNKDILPPELFDS
ncbi:N-acetylmuramate alpha-1-phosphate uridylyltransferase [subsurface metagenome]